MAAVRDRLHVLVVGAGVGGLAAARGLAARGHRVTVLERAPALTRVGGHLGVQSNAVLALRALGASAPVEECGVPVERFEIASWRGRRLAWWSPGALGREMSAPNVTVPRHVLLTALRDAALTHRDATELVFGAEVREIAAVDDGTGVTVRTADGRSFTGDLVVGADGVRSAVRRLAGLPGTPRTAGYLTWRGVAAARPPATGPHTARHYLGRGRTFGHWPLPDGRTYWVATRLRPGPSAGAAPAGPPDPADLPSRARELVGATPAHDILHTAVDTVEGCDTWHTGRVVLLGDAAHAMEPVTGQGGAQALLDALALATALAGVGAADGPGRIEGALADYAATRRGPARKVAEEARGLGGLHHLDNAVAVRVRDTVLRCTPHSVWQRRAALRLDERELLAAAAPAGRGTAPEAARR
ncbi:NAD(P)/FAD-dependent oxidoreductase [Streptomyces sp. NPDC006307]|uniref:FAD-dependent oxidoreductase n=1 Tax=Streptomyces sp. NPDC006307 TaxID=3156748 RepID=UPI0033BC0AE9